MTIVCGDSHTSTHGAFGALAFGIGTREVEHVLATQMPARRRKPKTMRDRASTGELPRGVTAKDVVLAIIAQHRRRAAASATSIEYARRGDPRRCRWKAA